MTEHLIDRNCRLLSRGYVDTHDATEAMEAMALLSEECSFSRFCLTLPFDASCESVSAFLIRRCRVEDAFLPLITQEKRFTVEVTPAVLLVPHLHEERGLERLCLSQGGYLPLCLPLGSLPEWADFELNRLLFKAHMNKLLFLSFDRVSLFYTEETVDRLLRIPNAVFQMRYPTGAPSELLLKMEKRKTNTVFGTEISSLLSAYRFCMDFDKKSATELSLPIADGIL